jgi:ABC-type uncharacterized transport system permease subunit
MYRKYYLLLLVLLFSFCGASKSSNEHTEMTSKSSADEIVFVVFKMQKGSNRNSIEIITTTKATGKMKADLLRPIDPENHLTLEIIENNQIVKTLHLEHPLKKIVEYLNENNQYVSKQVTADEGEFFIRIQKKAGQSKIRVLETFNGTTKNELQTFNL